MGGGGGGWRGEVEFSVVWIGRRDCYGKKIVKCRFDLEHYRQFLITMY